MFHVKHIKIIIINKKCTHIEDFKAATSADPEDYERYIEIYRNLDAAGYRDEAINYLNAALEISFRNFQMLF